MNGETGIGMNGAAQAGFYPRPGQTAASADLPQQGAKRPEHRPIAPALCHDLEQEGLAGNNGRQKKLLLNERKLTIAEAARALSIGATSLRRIIANGEIPVVRMTNKTLILESDLETYLAASRGKLMAAKPLASRLPQLPHEVATSKHLK